MVDTANSSPDLEQVHVQFGANLKTVREALGLSQEDLGKRVGLARSSIANIEAGRQRVSLSDVTLFSTALTTTPKHLLKGIWF